MVALVCLIAEAAVIWRLLQERRDHDAAQKELLNRLMYMANKPWVMPEMESETGTNPLLSDDTASNITWPDAVVG